MHVSSDVKCCVFLNLFLDNFCLINMLIFGTLLITSSFARRGLLRKARLIIVAQFLKKFLISESVSKCRRLVDLTTKNLLLNHYWLKSSPWLIHWTMCFSLFSDLHRTDLQRGRIHTATTKIHFHDRGSAKWPSRELWMSRIEKARVRSLFCYLFRNRSQKRPMLPQ